MDTFSRNLTLALLGSLAALPVGCLAGGLVFGVWSSLQVGGVAGFWPNIGLGITVGFVAVLIGILPTLLYGAPAYALVVTRYRPNLVAAVTIGALPGLALQLGSSDWGTFFLLFGVPVAICLHFILSWRIASHGSNKSFKGMPIRGTR